MGSLLHAQKVFGLIRTWLGLGLEGLGTKGLGQGLAKIPYFFSTKDDETTVDVGDSETRLTLSGSPEHEMNCSFYRFFWLQQLQKARRLYTHSSSVASSKSTVNSI